MDQPRKLKLDNKDVAIKIEWEMPSAASHGFTFPRPMQLCFKHVDYRVSTKSMTRRVIRNSSGFVNPGEILAVMGPSGCGKSTLMNILSGRIRSSDWNGVVLANGRVTNSHINRENIGFVTQEDNFLASLTVREQLEYAALLRLPKHISKEQKMKKVNAVIADLGLTNVQNTRIGNELNRGVSGGEKKRTNIGVELLSDPSILFLDEPTSGLDAYTAKKLMMTLRRLANEGRTIIVSLHQPRIDIFGLIDRILLMSAGEVCYFGPGRKESIDFLIANNIEVASDSNPFDIMLDTITEDNLERVAANVTLKKRRGGKKQPMIIEKKNTAKEEEEWLFGDAEEENAANRLVKAYEKMPLADPYNFPPPPSYCKNITGAKTSIQRPGGFYQFGLLYGRAVKNFYRNKMATFARAFIAVLLGVVCGTIFLNTTFTASGVSDKAGLIFVALMACSISVANNVVAVFPAERAVFLREYKSGTYGTFPYFFAKVLAEMPMQILVPVVQGSIAYWLASLRDDLNSYLAFIAVLVLMSLVSTMVGLTLSCSVSSTYLATVLTSPIMSMFLFLAGFLRTEANLPWFWAKVRFASFFRFAYTFMMCNEFDGAQFDCRDGCLAPNGTDYLKDVLKISCTNNYQNLYIIAAFYFGFATLGFITLYGRTKRS